VTQELVGNLLDSGDTLESAMVVGLHCSVMETIEDSDESIEIFELLL